MAVILELILIIAAIIAIISFFKPSKVSYDEENGEIGLYEVELTINGDKIKIKGELELLTEYDNGQIHVKHRKIFTVFDNVNTGIEATAILKNDHSIIKKTDVKWLVKK